MQGRRAIGRQAATGALAAALMLALWCGTASAAAPQVVALEVSQVGTDAATLKAEINPEGKATAYHFEYGTSDCTTPGSCTEAPVGGAEVEAGSSPVKVAVPIGGLESATRYHFLLEAENAEGKERSAERFFFTYAPPFEALPDRRAYEQATPVNKDGSDATGEVEFSKAAADGEAISFGSSFGVPGGLGAQELPLYLASRGAGQTGWSTRGLYPPGDTGERARVLGWLPDYKKTFASAARLGKPRSEALLELSANGPPAEVSPYVASPNYGYAGASEGGGSVVFEASAKLPPETGKGPIEAAIEGASNVYAWDAAAERRELASVMNDGASPPNGAFAGPYNWSVGTTVQTLDNGGAQRSYYLTDEHAVTPSGDTYFTAAGTGQLYLRENPTRPQSEMESKEGKEVCAKEEDACTLHVSASEKTNGKGPGGTNAAGEQPAAFLGASADGSAAFFTSPEELTNDAKTVKKEQPLASIARAGIGGTIEDAEFIPAHAVGVTVAEGHIYWADPKSATIGRADLDGENKEEAFISLSKEEECEVEVKAGVFEKKKIPNEPRYLAVSEGHIYWTNTGLRNKQEGELPINHGGTIGRADIEGTPASIKESVEAAFICNASNPQGIAANATHIYWANHGRTGTNTQIGRATLEGEEVEQEWFQVINTKFPVGVALDASHLYFTANEGSVENEGTFVERISLEGKEEEFTFVGTGAKVRGIAVEGPYVYWVAQEERAIGRLALAEFPKFGPCEAIPGCNLKFIEAEGTINGLAADEEHLYWASNGEAPRNPGNDLYRYEPATETLTDLTADANPEDENGAEVQGVLGISSDGSYVYFAANGDLDGSGPAKKGNCHGTVGTMQGKCSLYLWHEGQSELVATLKGSGVLPDSFDWTGTPLSLVGSNSYFPKGAFTTADGKTLLFSSQEKLTEYENKGVPELYRYQVGASAISCVSCRPTAEAPGAGPNLGSIEFPGIRPVPSEATSSRILSSDGERAFFETAEALSAADVNGEVSCPVAGRSPACTDVYEWEAPGVGSCEEGGPSYSALDEGCLFLISTGHSRFPSILADASASGNDVFFFTRDGLVKQDDDELQDVYDARVEGGLASQNPEPKQSCESTDSCHGPEQVPPIEPVPPTPEFFAPEEPPERRKHHHHRHHRHHAKRGGGR